MEWQPIETLKECGFKKQYVWLGFFHSDGKNYQIDENADCFVQLGYMPYKGSYYVVCGAPGNQHVNLWLDVKPTHWMPLPPPPETK